LEQETIRIGVSSKHSLKSYDEPLKLGLGKPAAMDKDFCGAPRPQGKRQVGMKNAPASLRHQLVMVRSVMAGELNLALVTAPPENSQITTAAILTKSVVAVGAQGVVVKPLSDASLCFETCAIIRTDNSSRLANEFARSFLRRYEPQRCLPPKQLELSLSA
jgi:hypothetical protein